MKKILCSIVFLMALSALLSACTTLSATSASPSAAVTQPTDTATATPAPTVMATPTAASTPTPISLVTPSATPEATPSAASTATPDGPAVLGIYQRVGGSVYHLLPELDRRWVKGVDICDLYIFASNKSTLSGGNYNKLFESCWNSFSNAGAYKLGYHVKFMLKTGEVVDLWIRSPKDAPKDPKKYFYQFVEVYMYDSLKPKNGPKRMHLVESAMKPDTLITSIKLTSGSRIVDVADITLGVFAYHSDSDFDASGKYIGRVLYEIPVVNKVGTK